MGRVRIATPAVNRRTVANLLWRNGGHVRFIRRVNHLPILLGALRRCCETFPDPTRGANATYRIADDIGMAAFSVFFMQNPSLAGASASSAGRSWAVELSYILFG